jgi:uncharacterized protein (DUF488 family)
MKRFSIPARGTIPTVLHSLWPHAPSLRVLSKLNKIGSTPNVKEDSATIYTIGHGRHPFAYFLELLRQYDIQFLCDVRSVARSRWPQYNGLVLAELLRENGIGYEHLPETGGKTRPKPEDLARGVDRIVEIASDVKTTIMCSESAPLSKHKEPRANCHRVGMLAPMLRAKGISRIIHILPNGEPTEFNESAVPSIW